MKSPAPSDETLFGRYRCGDSAGLEALVRRYEAPLYRFLVRYLGDEHLAEDVFQDTFVHLARAAEEFDAERAFRPWLYTIAANRARDALRKRKVRRRLVLEGPHGNGRRSSQAPAVPGALRHYAADPHEVAERTEEASVLREGVERLTPEYRSVVQLHFFQGLKYHEVAEALAIPLGTVKSRMHAAMRQLEVYWRERFGEVGEPWQNKVPTTSG